MKYTNRLSLLGLICVVSFLPGLAAVLQGIGVFLQMEHSWTHIDNYAYFVSTILTVLPLLVLRFSRKIAWLLLSIGLHIFTIATPIMVIMANPGLFNFSFCVGVFALGATCLLIVHNRRITDEIYEERQPEN